MDDLDTKELDKLKSESNKKSLGSLLGFFYTISIGFLFYFILKNFGSTSAWLDYSSVIERAGKGELLYKFAWMVMNFTEPQFYAGFLSSLSIILGGFVAWRLSLKKSKFSGFEICYDMANMWPWIFASQILSLIIAIFVLNFTRFFAEGYDWLPTFITVAGASPSLMLIYGPSYRVLFSSSILGGLLSFPIAFWLMTNIIPILNIPGVVGNVLTMAITGIIIGQIFKSLSWIKKTPIRFIEKEILSQSKKEKYQEMHKPSWFVRRVIADFSEAQFYGNEVAGLFILIGVSIEWLINSSHLAYASLAIPEIILSQFIGSSVGVLLYFNKYVEYGWYATYVPLVSAGPACVLMFGGSLKVAIIAGVLGGILGGPIAEYLTKKIPEDIHPTVANVSSMAITTTIVTVIIRALPWI